ncbi:Uncharacterised protein [Escherichia coli]|uniref:hypothetical protein n=1 Tax=Escherichia coli TaxID=562 RepID=UPI001918B766|nr:hypothetical protein [Escherichia coli]CAD5758024.1 Uncharacterised protein [Escherichia coli]
METKHEDLIIPTQKPSDKFAFVYATSHFLLRAIDDILSASGYNNSHISSHDTLTDFLYDLSLSDKKDIIILFIDIRTHINLLMNIRKITPHCEIVVISTHIYYIDRVISKYYNIGVVFSKENYPEDVIFFIKNITKTNVKKNQPLQNTSHLNIFNEIQTINQKVNSDLSVLGLTEIELSILYHYSLGVKINAISSKMNISSKKCYHFLYSIKVKLSGKVSFGKVHFDYIWARLESQILI